MPAILFLAFLAVPLVELAIIVQVEGVVGLGWTILALIGISAAGAALVRREGLKAWWRLREALAAGRLPTAEVVDGALLLVAGALLLTPGFLTDAVGLVLLVPLTRAAVSRLLRGSVRRWLGVPGAPGRVASAARRRARRREGDVLDVEVVEVRRDGGEPPASR